MLLTLVAININGKKRALIMNNKKVLNDLRKLDSLQVNYLDCDSYNQKQGNEYFENLPINKDLKAIYNSL